MKNIIVRSVIFIISLTLIAFGIYLAREWEFFLVAILISAGVFLALFSYVNLFKVAGNIISILRSYNDFGNHRKSGRYKAIALSSDELMPDEIEKAKILCEEAKSRPESENSPEDFLLIATQAWREGKNESAAENVFKGLNLNPKDSMVKAALLNRLGTIYEKLGKVDWAMRKYAEACITERAYPWPYFNIGNLFLQTLNDYKKGEEIYKQAVLHDPGNPFVHNNLGVLYRRINKYAEAEIEYKKAITEYPKFTKAYFNLGLLYQVQERYADAEKAFKTALDLSPEDPRIIINVQNLQKRN